MELYLRTAKDTEWHYSAVHSLGKRAATTSTRAATAVVLESTLHEVTLCGSIVHVQHIIYMEAGAVSSACQHFYWKLLSEKTERLSHCGK